MVFNLYAESMIALEKPPTLSVEEFQKFQDKMFATELMQTLVARCGAEIWRAIVVEEDKPRPNTARIEMLKQESRRLDDLDPETTEEIKAVVEELKDYTVPLPA